MSFSPCPWQSLSPSWHRKITAACRPCYLRSPIRRGQPVVAKLTVHLASGAFYPFFTKTHIACTLCQWPPCLPDLHTASTACHSPGLNRYYTPVLCSTLVNRDCQNGGYSHGQRHLAPSHNILVSFHTGTCLFRLAGLTHIHKCAFSGSLCRDCMWWPKL